MEKTCTQCGKTLPVGEFYRHKQTSDGLRPNCKECGKRLAKEYRDANLMAVREKDRARQGYKMPNSYYREYKKGRKTQIRANAVVHNELKRGRISRLPCIICGATEVEAHHPAYSLPLDVVWLCKTHHTEVHHD